ncbi:ABC transporter substrate-binding protein [Reinekea marinisedimentorum]|uniref:Glucose/mannose transport system substrate-binding protein n=1 Tax=Reinekea marinisedimentorum TaxID=230495 RepID=A0A4R3HZM1_9GAMM|nr:ABC transporter substrate-binding protein [Reinekea marinisedimentorum]TCS38857.1 glucose/mannose transport system substrate-binding protein [Reinekea marinisedimentorum]
MKLPSAMHRRVACCSLFLLLHVPGNATTLNLMHYWSSISETSAYSVMRVNVLESGHDISGTFLTGAGGESTREKLTDAALHGEAPDAAFVKGAGIARWARLGFLKDLSAYQNYRNELNQFYPIVRQQMEVNGKPYAIPVSLHRTNLVFSNEKLLQRHGITQPQNWDELISAMRTLKQRGIRPLAVGDEPWQLATIYESILLSVGGADLYRQAFVDNNIRAFKDPAFVVAYDRLQQLLSLASINVSNSRWYKPAEQFYNDQVGFLMGGDWISGELSIVGYKPGKNYQCFAMPGTENAFVYSVDSVAVFNQPEATTQNLQEQFIGLLVSEQVQREMNQVKGSIPPRMDVSLEHYSQCSVQAANVFKSAERNNLVLPSLANGMSASPFVTEAYLQVIADIFSEERKLSGDEFQKHLLKSLKKAQYTII